MRYRREGTRSLQWIQNVMWRCLMTSWCCKIFLDTTKELCCFSKTAPRHTRPTRLCHEFVKFVQIDLQERWQIMYAVLIRAQWTFSYGDTSNLKVYVNNATSLARRAVTRNFAVRLNECHERNGSHLDGIIFEKLILKPCVSIINKAFIDRHRPFIYIDI